MIITNNEHETITLGIKLGKLFKNSCGVILLEGTLAAGKTTLTKGIALGLGITETVKSPTFTIMRMYEENNQKLYHLDLYRLNEMGIDYDLEEYIDDFNSVVVIEWPGKVKELLPEEYLLIEIEGINNERKFSFKANGNFYKEVLNKL